MSMGKIKIATTAINCCYDKKKNLEKCLKYIDEAAGNGCSLIVFPEMVIQGYLNSLIGPISGETILYQQKNAEVIPEGETVQEMMEAARKHDIYIVWGMGERDRNVFDVIYNTVVLVGPEGFIGSYRKVHLSMDEKHVFNAGEEYPVYDTRIGKIGLEICFDKEFPEASRELMLGGAEILVAVTAWSEYIGDMPENMSGKLGARYDLLDSVRAMENQVWFISSNQFGKCGNGNFCGKSNIVDPNGYILATAGEREGIVCIETDIHEELLKARSKSLQTIIKHIRPDAYKRLTGGAGLEKLLTPIQNGGRCSGGRLIEGEEHE